ncbi:MAG: sulfotransferase [Rudaea sp.]|uniref:sulfotransferase family protein n=1 Tax=Rudaea sp. TaxID=2136325 RepID=UPI0039E409FF
MDPVTTRKLSRSEPPIIFVVGMHRSGTSVLAHAINLMGAFVGEENELVPAHPDINPTGYWERADIVTEHERFLQSSGFAWGTLANFEIERIDEDRRHALAAHLQGIVRRIAHADASLVIKDPRLCLMLPVWHEFATARAHVVVVRDPRKIAASLMAAFPDSFTTDFLLALWQKYMQSALSALTGERVLFVSYARMLEDRDAQHRRLWRGLNELGAAGLAQFDLDRLGSVLDGRLDRSEPCSHARLDDGQQKLFDWLVQHCDADGPVEVAGVPQISPPDPTLLELEKVCRTCLRNGWAMAANQASATARPPIARPA